MFRSRSDSIVDNEQPMAKGSHIPVGLDTPEILPRGHDYELALTDEWAHETGVLSVRSRRGSFRMSTLLTS